MLKGIINTGKNVIELGTLVGKLATRQPASTIPELDYSLGKDVVGKIHPEKVRVRVSKIIEETPSTKTFRLIPLEGYLPPFRAGQYVSLSLEINGTKTARPYSISSPPTRTSYIDITVRSMPDGFVSKHLCEKVKAGDEFDISGPAGSFYYEPLIDSGSLVFLAGGSGITPFMSVIRELCEKNPGLDVHLLYGNRTPDDIIFEEELAEIACQEDWFKMHMVISEPPKDYAGHCGFLDSTTISSTVGDISGKTFYVCGPLAMHHMCASELQKMGVPSRRVRIELAGPPGDITQVEGYPAEVSPENSFNVSVVLTGKEESPLTFKVSPTEPLLNSLERNSVGVKNLCRSGECGFCRTKLISGKVFVPPWVTLRASDLMMSYIHPCMSYPLSDLELIL